MYCGNLFRIDHNYTNAFSHIDRCGHIKQCPFLWISVGPPIFRRRKLFVKRVRANMVLDLRIVIGMDYSGLSRVGGDVLVRLQGLDWSRPDSRHFDAKLSPALKFNEGGRGVNHGYFRCSVLYEDSRSCLTASSFAEKKEEFKNPTMQCASRNEKTTYYCCYFHPLPHSF